MPLYQSCIATRRIHPVETCALNHHSWNLDPAAIRTVVTNAKEMTVPMGDTIENAAAHIGIDSNMTAIVVGGWNVAGKDLTPVSLSLCISICAYPKSNVAIHIRTPIDTYSKSGYQELDEISPVIATHAPAGANARHPPSHQWQSQVYLFRYG